MSIYVEPVVTDKDNTAGVRSRRVIFDAYREAEEKGFPPPTLVELKDATGLASTNTIHSHLKILHKRGTLNKKGRRYCLARVASVAEVQ